MFMMRIDFSYWTKMICVLCYKRNPTSILNLKLFLDWFLHYMDFPKMDGALSYLSICSELGIT